MTDNNDIPLYQKYALTIKEAAQYFNIGEKKLRQIANENQGAEYLLQNGSKTVFKRKLFENFLDQTGSV